MNNYFLTIDLGASSGRVFVVIRKECNLELEEIHRFENAPVMAEDRWEWDFPRLYADIKIGLRKAFSKYPAISAIGIDTWGVDYGLIGFDGKLLRNPTSYRSLRTKGIEQKVYRNIDRNRLYRETGIQYLHFNTLYQLKVDAEDGDLLQRTEKILLMPDLLAYYLTGKMRLELTNLSTTNLYNPHLRKLIDVTSLGIPERIFPELIYPEDSYGLIKEEVALELSIPRVPVIAVCTHDTASAVFSILDADDSIYISSGTWSLCGVLLDKPVTTDSAREENYTNEVGYAHRIRFLKNVMGLWIINQCREEWHSSYAEIAQAAETADYGAFIDPDDALFETPGPMVARIQEYCRKTGQREPETIGEIALTVYQSLAFKYRYVIEGLERLLERKYAKITIIGGGSNVNLLNCLTANVCSKTVITGAQEATVLGNALVLMKATNAINNLSEGRTLIRNSISEKRYLPEKNNNLDEKYRQFCRIIKGDKDESSGTRKKNVFGNRC